MNKTLLVDVLLYILTIFFFFLNPEFMTMQNEIDAFVYAWQIQAHICEAS